MGRGYPLVQGGETLELDREARVAAEQQQASHMESDPRDGLIQEWLDQPIEDEMGRPTEDFRDRVCASQIWTECLGNKKGSLRSWEAKEIMSIMRSMPGWEERKGKAKVTGYGVQRVFERLH